MRWSALILAGGQSTRMGRDKCFLMHEGRTLLEHAVGKARQLGVEEVFISGRPGQDYAAAPGCPVLLDRQPGLGPLAGLSRGLECCASPLLLVLAVDLPQMTVAFLRGLATACGESTGVVPRIGRRIEPLAALYPKTCQGLADQWLAEGRLAVGDFARACARLGAVRWLRVSPADAALFGNWNRPADVPGSRPAASRRRGDPAPADSRTARACIRPARP